MIICECKTWVKTKFCPTCGTQCNGDSMILKWIAECETNLKYWCDKDDANPSDGMGDIALSKKCQVKIKMWKRRIELLKAADAEKVSE